MDTWTERQTDRQTGRQTDSSHATNICYLLPLHSHIHSFSTFFLYPFFNFELNFLQSLPFHSPSDMNSFSSSPDSCDFLSFGDTCCWWLKLDVLCLGDEEGGGCLGDSCCCCWSLAWMLMALRWRISRWTARNCSCSWSIRSNALGSVRSRSFSMPFIWRKRWKFFS